MEYFQFLTSTTLITGAIVYLGKLITNNFFNRGIERFKSELIMTVNQHQITYGKLHNERAEVIKELYSKLVRVVRIMEDLCAYPTSQKAKDAIPVIIELKSYFEERRIYFDVNVSSLIEDIISNLHNGYFEASFNAEHNVWEIPDEKIKEQTIINRLEGWKKIKNKIPELKEILEKDFRGLLGTTVNK